VRFHAVLLARHAEPLAGLEPPQQVLAWLSLTAGRARRNWVKKSLGNVLRSSRASGAYQPATPGARYLLRDIHLW